MSRSSFRGALREPCQGIVALLHARRLWPERRIRRGVDSGGNGCTGPAMLRLRVSPDRSASVGREGDSRRDNSLERLAEELATIFGEGEENVAARPGLDVEPDGVN